MKGNWMQVFAWTKSLDLIFMYLLNRDRSTQELSIKALQPAVALVVAISKGQWEVCQCTEHCIYLRNPLWLSLSYPWREETSNSCHPLAAGHSAWVPLAASAQQVWGWHGCPGWILRLPPGACRSCVLLLVTAVWHGASHSCDQHPALPELRLHNSMLWCELKGFPRVGNGSLWWRVYSDING